MSECFRDGTDVGVLNVKLKGAVGFEGYAIFVAWFTEDEADVACEDSGDGGFHNKLLPKC